MDEKKWKDESKWEAEWWGSCLNTLGEELKQLAYAKRMGLIFKNIDGRTPYSIDMQGKTVLDIGGGPCSLLLKCVNLKQGWVVDPCDYPAWVSARYSCANIGISKSPAESWHYEKFEKPWDEVWIYNCLQHVMDPALIIQNIRKASRVIRLFEWLEIPVSPGHPWFLIESQMNDWLGGEGRSENINDNGAIGKCYHGIFMGDHYGK